MALAEFKSFISPIIRIGKSIVSIIAKKCERNYTSYSFFKSFGAFKLKDEFPSIYYNTLYNLNQKNKKHYLIKLFTTKEVKEAFYNEVYKNNNWDFELKLDSNLHTNPQLRFLKKYDIDLEKEIDEFRKEFKILINEARTPSEVDLVETTKKIEVKSDLILEKVSLLENSIKEKYGSEIKITNDAFLDSSPFPLVNHFSSRETSTNLILNDLSKRKWIALIGEIGTGKTQFAILISKKYQGELYWIGLRENELNSFFSKIIISLASRLNVKLENDISSLAKQIIDLIPKNSLIILDDLPKITGNKTYDNMFVTFVKEATNKGVKFISTSNFGIFDKVKESFVSQEFEEKKIPFFTEDETEDVLISFGCDEAIAKGLKKLIRNISYGHPTIITAISKYLSSRHWKVGNEELTDLFKESYSLSLNEETQTYLVDTIEDEYTRELIYRLQPIIGTFSESEVRIVSEINPSIKNPIEKFNQIIGLWIQKETGNKYQLSPLIKRLKVSNLTLETELKINYSLGRNILDKKSLNQFDANNAIIYFIKAKEVDQAGFVLTMVLREAVKDPNLYFEFGYDLYWHTTSLPNEMDLLLRQYIRVLQIQLNQNARKDNTFLITDLELIIQEAEAKGLNTGPALLLLASHYAISDTQKANSLLIKSLKSFDDLLSNEIVAQNITDKFQPEVFIWFPSFGVKSQKDAENWFKTFEKLPKTKQANALNVEGVDTGCLAICHNLFKNEEEGEQPNWNNLINIYNDIKANAIKFNIHLLFSYATKYQILVQSEKLSAIDEAIKTAEEACIKLANLNLELFLIKDIIGRELFFKNRKQEAIKYLADAISIPIPETRIEKIDTYLIFSQAIGDKDSKTALHYSNLASQICQKNEDISKLIHLKVMSENAISLWNNGNRIESILLFEKISDEILKYPDQNSDWKNLLIRLQHVFNYYHSIITTQKTPEKTYSGEVYTEPYRGMFFNTNNMEESYFKDRKYILCFLLMKTFEYLNNEELALKWGKLSYDLLRESTSNFTIVTNQFMFPYLIMEYKFNEAIELAEKISSIVMKGDILEIETSNTALKKYINEKPNLKTENFDEILLEQTLVPIIFKILYELELENEKGGHLLEKFIKDLSLWAETSQYKDLYLEVKEILKEVSRQNSNPNSLMNHGNSYKGKFSIIIKTISYLCCSYINDPLNAFKIQVKIVNKIEGAYKPISVGSYKFIIIPFFEIFWKRQFDKYKKVFFSPQKLENDGLYRIGKSNIDDKLKNIFKIFGYHLEYEFNDTDESWIEK